MTKNRHELPRKKPTRPAKEEIAEELPVLEPVDELPTLEPVADELPTLEAVDEAGDAVVDDGPIQVVVAAGDGRTFDTVFTVTVPAMDKQAVLAALSGPLQRHFAAQQRQVRHQRVLVQFAGEGVVGSAAKETIGKLLAAHRPLLGVVDRGFGQETVAEGRLPEVQVTVQTSGASTVATIATGNLEPVDLPIAFAAHWSSLLAGASGKKLKLVVQGSAKPDSTQRAEWADAAKTAGASAFAVGERVYFDLDLQRRVQCTVQDGVVNLLVDPADLDATTDEALSMVLPEHGAACRGAVVRIATTRPADGARDRCVAFAREHGARRIEVVVGGAPQIVWPGLLEVGKGAEVVVRVLPNGRSRDAVLAALVQEAAGLQSSTKGKPVLVDWPRDFVVDAAALTALHTAASVMAARSVAFALGGELREPVLPVPITCTADGERLLLRLDSEAGKAAELQRAFDRATAPLLATWRGRSLRVQIAGSAVVSRTLLRTICSAIEAAGVMQLEVEEAGVVDVLLPAMLTFANHGDAISVAAVPGKRDAAQVQLALVRELDALSLPAGGSFVVGASSASDAVLAALQARGAARLVLDGPEPVQVHPPLFAAPQKKVQTIRLELQPGGDPAMTRRQLARELPSVLAGLSGLSTATVQVVWPGIDPAAPELASLVAALADKKAKKVVLEQGKDKPLTLHPAPQPKVVPAEVPTGVEAAAASAGVLAQVPSPAAAPAVRARVSAGTAASAAAPTNSAPLPATAAHLTVLGRRDEAVPPMVLLGVAVGTDPAHVAAVEAELQAHLPRFRGRSVLLVPQQGGRDVPVRKPDALVDMLRRVVPTGAAATLVFRGPDAQGRAHFQVLHSSLRALPIGGVFADPRVPR
ncbi:MAG: hypothetical protein JNL12_01355 [Planctomycetes bacterium]|nr:hypothetical protein [Planctomycetota bacterium]